MPQWVNPGEMRTAVGWFRPINATDEVDDNNRPKTEWQRLGTIFGKLRAMGGQTAEEARELVHQKVFRFTCQYVDGLQLVDELRFDGRRFAIGDIDDIEYHHRQQQLTLTEVQSEQ